MTTNTKPRRRLPRDLRSRVLSQAMISPDGCWLWTGPKSPSGYGMVTTAGSAHERKTFRAHRAAYELYYGPIPDGLQLDHLCRVRHCINPSHLEPVTAKENLLRSPITSASINSKKTECPKGHPYDEKNTGWAKRGHRQTRYCRTCNLSSVKKSQSKRKGAA